jgi:hemolysin-activating ACP:hemolysin acyltransferase
MNSIAPIVLFTYKRLDTLKQCIDALKKCPEAPYSDLVIVADYQNTETDCEKVANVRQFLSSITGFKSVEIIEREKNYGVDYNIIEGIKMMAARFPQFIVVEDDLVVKKGFLTFLNKALLQYENHSEVLTVSAFNWVNTIPKNYLFDVYFAKRTNPWGWATWSYKINTVDWELQDKEGFLKDDKNQKKFNEWGSDRSSMLINTINNKIRAWDIRLDYNQFRNSTTTVYPIVSLVDNIGFGDLDASNTFGYNRFKAKNKINKLDVDHIKFSDAIVYNTNISKKFIDKNSILERFITQIMKRIGYKN